MTVAQQFHIFFVTVDLILGFVALCFGVLTLLKKPLFEKQALVHKHLGRWWVFMMMVTAYQSTVRCCCSATCGRVCGLNFCFSPRSYSLRFQFAVEVGTPMFIVYLMTALYFLTGAGVYIIRVRGDLKESEKYAKNEKLFQILKICHGVVMLTAWLIVLSAAGTDLFL